MKLSRRSFLKGSTASAVVASSHVLGFASRAFAAGGPEAPILVLVNLSGGNDLLNTVVPLDDVGAPQRTLYETLRPDLALPPSALEGMAVGDDPALGTALALHPQLAGLKQLHDEGRVAFVLGAGIAGSSLSHFDAEKAWFFGRPDVRVHTTGWIGRQLDLAADGRPHAVSFGGEVSPVFDAELSDALGVGHVDSFDLPDDPVQEWRNGAARAEALRALLALPRSGMRETAARSGRVVLDQAEFLGGVATTGWGSSLESEGGAGRSLREIASILRHDALHPGSASGFRFYHVRITGFDTHAQQGTLDPAWGQPRLLSDLSRWLGGFQQDLDALGLSDRVLTLVYSEFGRRVAQSGSGREAGTDHGAGGLMFLMGDRVVGGLHGALPRLDQLDADGNLAVSVDFRRVYAAVIDDFLGGDHTPLLAGAPFAKLPVIQS
jgi:uncharacterized protein (DUF1501 family)